MPAEISSPPAALSPSPSAPAPCLQCHVTKAGSKQPYAQLDDLGSGHFALPHPLPAGSWELYALYHEIRAEMRSALLGVPAAGLADETQLEPQLLLALTVRAGPAAAVMLKLKQRSGSAACNNTTRLTALHEAELKLMDKLGNLTVAPAGRGVRLCCAVQPPAAALAAGAPLHDLPSPDAFVTMPPPVTFDVHGVAKLGVASVHPNVDVSDCTLIFSFALDGWEAGDSPELPDPIHVRFENTARQEAIRRRELEARAEKLSRQAEERDRLQSEHFEDMRTRHTNVTLLQSEGGKLKTHIDEALSRLAPLVRCADAQGRALVDAQGVPLAHLQATAKELSVLYQLAEAEVRRRKETRFHPQPGLNAQEERVLVEHGGPDYIGTFGTIFELARVNEWTRSQVSQLAAVLSDYLGPEALRMVVTRTRDAAVRIKNASQLRVFNLDGNTHRPFLSHVELHQQFGRPAWCAGSLLRVRRVVIEQAGNEGVQLTEQLTKKLIGASGLANTLIMMSEKDALDYQQLMASHRKRCPAVLALDGFVLSGAGWFGGRNAQKRTDLKQFLPHHPHFGHSADEGIGGTVLPETRQRIERALLLENEMHDLQTRIQEIDRRSHARQEQAMQLGGRLNDDPAPHSVLASAAMAAHYPPPATRRRTVDHTPPPSAKRTRGAQ